VAAVGGEAGIRQFMASNPTEGGGDRWLDKLLFIPNLCNLVDTPPQPAGCSAAQLYSNAGDEGMPADVTLNPLVYWAPERCSTIGSDPAEVTARAFRRLELVFADDLEKEFWTGTVTRANNLSNEYLTDGNVSILKASVATPMVYALTALQSAWAACSGGQRAMIHCTPATAALWAAALMIRKENGLLLDIFDNIVVAGAGYDGSSPTHTVDATGATAWAYISPMVYVRATTPEAISLGTERMDKTNNIDRAVAWRGAVAYHDNCCKFGVNVDLTSVCS